MWKIVRITLMVFGALFLVIFAWVAGSLYFSLNVERTNKADRDDVIFIFHGSGLNPDQEFSIEYSYESPRSLLGDHHDVYCLQLSDISMNEAGKWVRGTESNPLFVQARKLAMQEGQGLDVPDAPCLDPKIDPNSADISAYIGSLRLYERSKISDYQVFLLHRPTKLLLAVDYAS